MRNAVGRTLNLKEESWSLFGIYAGQLGDPDRLCLSHCMLDNTENYCFQRLAPNKEEELRIISKDENALKLVFWEVKWAYDNGRIFPRPKEEIRKNMELQRQFIKLVISNKTLMTQLTQEYLSRKPKPIFSNHSLFVEVVRTLPQHYLSYDIVDEECTLLSDLDTDPPIKKGSTVHIATDSDRIIVLDPTGEHELASWRWNEIVLCNPTNTRMDEEDATSEQQRRHVAMSFASPRCWYYHTISKHFQKFSVRRL